MCIEYRRVLFRSPRACLEIRFCVLSPPFRTHVCGGQILSDPARVAVASDGRIRGSFPATGWLRSWGSSPLQRLAPAHAPERVSARSRIRGSRRCSDEPCPATNGVTRALCWPCWPFPAVRHAPFEDFPSSTAVSPHDDRCLPAVAVPPSPRPQPKLRSDTVVRPPDPGLAMLRILEERRVGEACRIRGAQCIVNKKSSLCKSIS